MLEKVVLGVMGIIFAGVHPGRSMHGVVAGPTRIHCSCACTRPTAAELLHGYIHGANIQFDRVACHGSFTPVAHGVKLTIGNDLLHCLLKV